MPSPLAISIIVGLVLTIGSGGGAWWYRGEIDAGEVKAALDARKVSEDASIAKAEAKGRADTQKLADDQANRANQAEQELAKEKTAHAADIKASHASLAKSLHDCRVARSDVSVLDGPATVPGPAAAPASPTIGQQRDDSGTVGAVTIVETCERNKGHFDDNLSKLEQCIADYDELASKLNAKPKGKTP